MVVAVVVVDMRWELDVGRKREWWWKWAARSCLLFVGRFLTVGAEKNMSKDSIVIGQFHAGDPDNHEIIASDRI